MPRILVVDDDPIVLEVLRGLLEEDDREIRTASGAAAALEIARGVELAVALVDKNLGPDDGLALSRRLKEVQPETEIILITGYASIESAIEAVQIGAFDYLQKPIADFGALGVKVQSAIEKSALRRSQRALLERLVECEVRHRRVIDAAPEAVILYDAATGAIVEANESAVALYGYRLQELLAMRADGLRVQGRDAPTGPHPVVQRHRRKDGTEFPADVTFAEFTQQGRTLKVQSARDLTARIREEQQHRELQEKLQSVQKLDAVARLACGIAHDFSNLCQVVQGHAEFLAAHLKSKAAKEELAGIRRATQEASELIGQLRLFGRAGPREEKAFDLCAAVSEAREMLVRLLAENIELRGSAPAGPLPVVANAAQITQVILNLAVNARDAMPEGGTLSIDLGEERLAAARVVRGGSLRAGHYAHLRVSDTGTGMTAEVQQRLFEPFFTTKPDGKASGLGLAAAYGIVTTAGGGIEVESETGKGSVFHVWLPLSDAAAARPEPPETPVVPGRGEKVLLVEDEDALRIMIGRALSASGYKVIEAIDGEDGLRAAGDGPVDILITDVMMPKLDGPSLASALKRTRPELKVLYMTGWSEQAERAELREAPFIHKPFTTGVLLAEVRRMLDGT